MLWSTKTQHHLLCTFPNRQEFVLSHIVSAAGNVDRVAASVMHWLLELKEQSEDRG